ncbi:hypothetical protein [Ensifer sp. 22564]|uniref:hypothetical protein n=1 Tax=Ensifer sp. 22564 TaxID=3453943 RepID=UPI003F83ABC0
MTFLEAYAKYGPDTIAIADALDIKEHEADALINEKMNRDYLRAEAEYIRAVRKPEAAPAKPVRFAGFDETEKSWW